MKEIAKKIEALRLEIVENNEYTAEIESVCQKLMAIENEIDPTGTDWSVLSGEVELEK